MTQVSTDRRFGINASAAIKVPVKAATTANITLSGEQTIDGISCVTDDRVLVQEQTDATENGVYIVDTGAWERAPDFDGNRDVVYGTLIPVNEGSTYGISIRRVTNTSTVTIGTTELAFGYALFSNATGISFLQSGIGASTRNAQTKLRELSLSLMDFTGADNTGASDNTAALVLCMNKAFESATLTTNLVIDLPDGNFLFTQNNPFGSYSVSADARQHVTFRGTGRHSTTITFKPGGSSDVFLYDGSTGDGSTASDNQLLFALFEGIGFVFDDTGMTGGTLNFVRQCPKTGTPNQNFQHRDCRFVGPSTAARAGTIQTLRGTINASENSFYNCRASAMKSVIDSTNTQAVNQYVFGCDWESMVGDIYKFVDGGGQLTHVGGSIIYGSSLTSDAYILNLQASTGLGTNFNLYGVKTELNDTNALIVNVSGANNSCEVNFRDCDFGTTGGAGSRTVLSVQPNCPASVLFDRCNLIPTSGGPYLYAFKNGTASHWLASQFNGVVEFRDCKLPVDIHDKFSWGTNSLGLFRIRGGHSTSSWTPDSDPNIAWDCDLTNKGQVRAPSANGALVKSWPGLIYYWPDTTFDTDGDRTRIKLPVDSIIKGIKLRKVAFGGSGSSYKLAVTNDDGTYTYGFTTTATQASQHDFTDAAIWRRATSGVNQYIRVIAVKELAYDTQTGNFTVGLTITDGTTGTTAKILADSDSGATGTLTIGFITGGDGTFGVGNTITDTSTGSANAAATTSREGSGVAQTMAAGDIYVVEYL